MKEDVQIPDRPPRKRRQMEQALDLWIATWLARDDLTPSERRRCEEEKQRRKENDRSVIVGFTGTRAGVTPEQKRELRTLIESTEIREGHHGDCLGGDVAFHDALSPAHVDVIVHPPKDARYRAFCHGIRSEPALPFLQRNKKIVQASTVLWATPKERTEPPPARGQGTWSTIRYARHRGVPTVIIWPDGTVERGG